MSSHDLKNLFVIIFNNTNNNYLQHPTSKSFERTRKSKMNIKFKLIIFNWHHTSNNETDFFKNLFHDAAFSSPFSLRRFKSFSEDNTVPDADAHASTPYSFCFPCFETSGTPPKGFCPTELPLQKVLRLSKNLLCTYSPPLSFSRIRSHVLRRDHSFWHKKTKCQKK